MTVTSPASSGPAGAAFEGRVGAHYLLSLLVGRESRGLPGVVTERVEFQRAAEGHSLDDVVVRGHDNAGHPAVLEIQVKRGLRFTQSDNKFRGVVAQIAQSSRQPGFFNTRHELAIAVGRAPLAVQGPYQDVLTWARQLDSSGTFIARIERPHSSNTDMRSFVDAFRTHLEHLGFDHDAETVWRLLSRLQILHFDFTAQGSAHDAWQRERAAHALHPDDAGKADALWRCLVELAIETATSGGDRDRNRLVEDLRKRGFRLGGDRRYALARSALAEDARHALQDVNDRVRRVRLTRGHHLAAIRAGLEEGRYMEIRGEPGVGKSGLLRHFAEQLSTQSPVLVLSPGRVRGGGWGAMRAALGFDGTARELLVDLAASGGAVLFIDGLDSFSEDERLTVADLVREAAEVPGFPVVATARRDYAGENDELDWLPTAAIGKLGRATPVTVGDLGTDEVGELCDAAPELAPLLADDHPARAIARNLYRLDRLARQSDDEWQIRTEIDLATDWWRTADGRKNSRRKRARLLRALAKQALASATLDASPFPAAAVDALIGSRALRDLGGDRVAFSHDVLRDWAVASLLFEDPDILRGLPLNRPPPAHLVRGFELTARINLERAKDGGAWRTLLDTVSQDGVHGSWRRTVLLAVVRSEIGTEMLTRVAASILANDARLLIELIRIVKAIEVRPLSEHLASFDLAVPEAEGMHLPSGPSWTRLMLWLLALGDDLPQAATADAADFFTASCIGVFGHRDLAQLLADWYFRRLEGVEAHRSDQLASNLRLGFLVVCRSAPALARQYLLSLMQCNVYDEAIKSLWPLSSLVAQAAPQELANLTVAMLIPSREDRRTIPQSGIPGSLSDLPSSGRSEIRREPFGSGDLAFTPPSHTQGPFLALLDHAPATGLKLVHRLVDHAVSVRGRGQPNGDDTMTITFVDGTRVFSQSETYRWSRNGGNADSCVQCALMALEAWAHRRVERDEDVEVVLADVLSRTADAAAYLLVAVDLILSHWPKSRKAAIPFLACPELLSLDLQRLTTDNVAIPDSLGFGPLFRTDNEPSASDNLEGRPSRHLSLDALLGHYVISGPSEMRLELANLLQEAVERLGPYAEHQGKLHPAFMAAFALNAVTPDNWRETRTIGPTGEPVGAWEYVPPSGEKKHLDRLRASTSPSFVDQDMQFAILDAVDNPSRASSELASKAMDWVLRPTPPTVDKDWDRAGHRHLATIAAAVIAMRDGDDDLRDRHCTWARDVFLKALTDGTDNRLVPESNIRFNPVAMAFIGIVQLLRAAVETVEVRALLEAASRRDLLAASGFRATANTIATIDERLPRALLRIAFASCIGPRRRRDRSEEDRSAEFQQRDRDAIDKEISWLSRERDEPVWPVFPMVSPARAEGLRIRPISGKSPRAIGRREARIQTDEYVDNLSAATWLSSASGLFDVEARPWLRDLVRSYSDWTAVANGSKLKPHERPERRPFDWNAAYFGLIAHCLPGLGAASIDELALNPIRTLPDEPFFEVGRLFLRSLDQVYFGRDCLVESEAVRIRASLAERLSESYRWTSGSRDPSASIEVHLGSVVAALFFNNWDRLPPSSCYLLSPGIARIDPFLPILQRLAVDGPGGFVAGMVLALMEVTPKPAHLSFIVTTAEAWLTAHTRNTRFWIDIGTARRLCSVIDSIQAQVPFSSWEPALQDRVGHILSFLVGLGVPEAGRVELAIADSD